MLKRNSTGLNRLRCVMFTDLHINSAWQLHFSSVYSYKCCDFCRRHKDDDLLTFYQYHFQIKVKKGPQPAAGFQQEPKIFVKEYLQPYDSAFRAIMSVNDENSLAAEPPELGKRGQYDADIKWSRSILYQLNCFPTQGWRTPALLAVKLAQNYQGNAKQAAAWLKCFMTELEAISLAALFVLGAKATARRQKTFDAVIQSLLHVSGLDRVHYVGKQGALLTYQDAFDTHASVTAHQHGHLLQACTCSACLCALSIHFHLRHLCTFLGSLLSGCLLQVDPAQLSAGEVIETVFRPVWQEHFPGSGKIQLLTEINKSFLYKTDNGSWAKAVLLVVEHIMLAGRGTGGAGGRGSQWDGTLSIEHILPQVSINSVLQTFMV